jgi:hypothetical protein
MGQKPKKHLQWFYHDTDAMGDSKLRAIGREFGYNNGYAFFFKSLEKLGRADFLEVQWSDQILDDWAYDFHADADEIERFVQFCVRKGIFTLEDGILWCQSLKDRHEAYFEKLERDRLRHRQKKQKKTNRKPEKKTTKKPPTSPEKTGPEILKIEKISGGEKVILQDKTVYYRMNGNEIIDSEGILAMFLDQVRRNFPNVTPGKTWGRDSNRLLQEFTPDQLFGIFRFVVEDKFYRKVVQSPGKLLQRNRADVRWIDKIVADMENGSGARAGPSNGEMKKPDVIVIRYGDGFRKLPVQDIKSFLKGKSNGLKDEIIKRLGACGYAEPEIKNLI